MKKKLKILFIAQNILKKELGGPKVVMELGEAIHQLGHQVTVIDPIKIADYLREKYVTVSKIGAENVKKYILMVSDQYDVIDVDANYLYLYENRRFGKPLIVSRSVLLIPHLEDIRWPTRTSLISSAIALLKSIIYGDLLKKKIERFYQSLNQADLINVSNHKDVQKLIAVGYSEKKIVNFPYGLDEKRKQAFSCIAKTPKDKNKIAFIGTFDFRKGCLDIPKIFGFVKEQVPDAELRLFGAKGLFQTEEEINSFFPKDLQKSISVILNFRAEELPELIKSYKVGMFPSYFEGFGFSVIELCSAGIPVISYDAPGPSSILSSEYLVPSGNWKKMAEKLIFYLKNQDDWENAHQVMLAKSDKYDWNLIGRQTVNTYLQKLDDKLETKNA